MSGEPVIDEPLVLPFVLVLAKTNAMAHGRMARLRRPGSAVLPIGETPEWAAWQDASNEPA
jgi:hypothetical protein